LCSARCCLAVVCSRCGTGGNPDMASFLVL
jgi:hypothetical protein